MLQTFADIDALPESCAGLLAAEAQESFFLSAAWWRSVQQAGLPARAAPLYVLCSLSGVPVALFPLLTLHNGRAVASLTNPYTCLYRPLLAAGLDVAILHRIGEAFGRFCRRWPALRLDALPQEAPGMRALLAGLRRAGMRVERFDQFGNWHQAVEGLSWPDYLQSRPGELRATIRRKLRRAGATCEILSAPRAVEAGIATYEAIYASSWKTPEPFPRFNAQMMRHAAEAGVLRLGVLHAEGKPVAAQLWIVANGQASVLKLAHDEAFKTLSPGTVLTAMMIRHLLEDGRVAELDFGRGDDGYKKLWAGARRQHIGLLLINPHRLRGLAMLAHQQLGRVRAWAVGRLA